MKYSTLNAFFCCGPTYEELKQEMSGIIGILGGSCEPTYEELKQEMAKLTAPPSPELRAYL